MTVCMYRDIHTLQPHIKEEEPQRSGELTSGPTTEAVNFCQ